MSKTFKRRWIGLRLQLWITKGKIQNFNRQKRLFGFGYVLLHKSAADTWGSNCCPFQLNEFTVVTELKGDRGYTAYFTREEGFHAYFCKNVSQFINVFLSKIACW